MAKVKEAVHNLNCYLTTALMYSTHSQSTMFLLRKLDAEMLIINIPNKILNLVCRSYLSTPAAINPVHPQAKLI